MAPRPIPWTLAEILEATCGQQLGGVDAGSFTRVGIDSRALDPDSLFVAIKGERHDGHDFIQEVIDQGCRGILMAAQRQKDLPVSRWAKEGVTLVAVADTIRALGALAAFRRLQAGISLVAITGSNGKTSTRRMTAAVMGMRFGTLASSGNFNNEIGLPLTLLGLARDHSMAVVELGMNHPGEIARLTRICNPQIGVITNVAPAHLEGVQSLDGVRRAKGELLHEMTPGGRAVLNADDPSLVRLGAATEHKVLWFGINAKAQVRATNIAASPLGSRFTLHLPDGRVPIGLNLPGGFMVGNALAAAGAGHLAGCTPDQIKAGLESVAPAPGRMVHVKTARGLEIVDDTYNANPGSMAAAFETMAVLSPDHSWVLVCGDMLELGQEAPLWHRRIGREAVERGAAAVYAHGPHSPQVARGAREAGLEAARVLTGDKADLVEALQNHLKPPVWALVKGSRGMAMETVVRELVQWAGGTVKQAE